jgi:hypothetical protein
LKVRLHASAALILKFVFNILERTYKVNQISCFVQAGLTQPAARSGGPFLSHP